MFNRKYLIEKAYAIADDLYENVRECRKEELHASVNDCRQNLSIKEYDEIKTEKAISAWCASVDSLAELLDMSEEEYWGFFDSE